MMQKNAFEELGIIDFNKLNQIQQSIQPISLGCPILDSFLKGGLRPNLLTEICGEAGSGKSQLALQIMLNATLNETKDTIENYSYYISTQKPLNDTRLNQLKLAFLQRNRLKNPRDLDNHLILKHATNLHDFNFWLSSDLSQRLEENNKIKVLVIDTIAGICNEFISNSRGSSNYDTLERRNFLVKTSQLLKKFAHQHNLAVIVLNNVTSNINEDADIRKEKLVPALGLIWSNMVNERFKMKRVKTHASRNMGDNDLVKEKVKRMFSIKFSPRFPRKKQAFYIENNGVFGWTDG